MFGSDWLTINQAQDIISRIKYKNWSLWLEADHGYDQANIIVETGLIPDTYNPRMKVRLKTVHTANLRSEDYLVESVYDAIRINELHEMAECFKYNGVIINDPHGKKIRPCETSPIKAKIKPDFVAYTGQPIRFLGE